MIETKVSEEVKLLHPLTQSLLRDFGNMFPNDLSPRLPLLRGIEHQIDLVLGATLQISWLIGVS